MIKGVFLYFIVGVLLTFTVLQFCPMGTISNRTPKDVSSFVVAWPLVLAMMYYKDEKVCF